VPPPAGISTGKSILIAGVSAAVGALLIRIMDKTVFAEDTTEVDRLRAELARHQGAGPHALPPGQPAQVDTGPRPGIVRIEIPSERMTDEFWERLAGEGYE
jgi:hypothetical protein